MKTESDLQKFTRLVVDYRGRFVRFANTYTRDPVVAEDIVMDALLYYWEHRQELKSDSNIPAYILSVIKHKCLNYLQHERLHADHLEKLRDIQQWELQTRIRTLQACEPEELFTAEAREIVNTTLDELPEQTRRIFLMSRNENKSHKEIAELLGMTTKGVEFHISKALKLLRKNLRDYFPLLAYWFL